MKNVLKKRSEQKTIDEKTKKDACNDCKQEVNAPSYIVLLSMGVMHGYLVEITIMGISGPIGKHIFEKKYSQVSLL